MTTPVASTAPPASPRLIALIISAAMFVEGLDSSIILTSLPSIAADLGETAVAMGGVVSAYFMALAVMLPMSGWLADRLGGKSVYCGAVGLFLIGSLICACAGSVEVLIVGRLVQGGAGALMTPVGRVILARSVSKSELLRVMNYTIMPGLVGSAIGPVVGGFITHYFSWRWNFLINVPLGLVGVGLALAFLPSTPRGASRSLPFDWIGFGLVAGWALCLQVALQGVGSGLPLVANLMTLSAAVLLGGLYVVYARGRAGVLIDLTLLRIRTFRMTILSGSLIRIGVYAAQFLLPLFLQLALGFDPLEAGIFAFIGVFATFVIRPVLSSLLKRFGFRVVLVAASGGSGLLLAGFGLFTAPLSFVLLGLYILIFGLFRSSMLSSLGALGLADIEPIDMGRSTTMTTLAQRLSMGLGVALGSVILAISASGAPRHGDFAWSFFIAGGLAIVGAATMLWLSADDGWRVSGHRHSLGPNGLAQAER